MKPLLPLSNSLRIYIFGLIIISMASSLITCSGGGDSINATSDSGSMYIIEVSPITDQVDENTYVTNYETISIIGSITGLVSPIDGICGDVAYDPNITVTWSNLTSDATGTGGMHWVTECGFTCDCLPRIGVTAELIYGENKIEIKAQRQDGVLSKALLTIIKTGPGIPKGVSAIPGDGTVTISWDDVTNADSYNLYWETISSDPIKIENVTSPYVHEGLINAETYRYQLTAVNQEGESPLSSSVYSTPGWSMEVIDTSAQYSKDNEVKISIDSNDVIHIISSFIDADTNNTHTKHYTNAASNWQEESISFTPNSFPDAAIALGIDDTIHISRANQNGVTYSSYSTGAWPEELIWPYSSCSSSITVDSNNYAHIVFHSGATYYSTNKSGIWDTIMVDATVRECPDHTLSSIKVDIDNNVYIADIVDIYGSGRDLVTIDNVSGVFVEKELIVGVETMAFDLHETDVALPSIQMLYEKEGAIYYLNYDERIFDQNNDTVPALSASDMPVRALSVCGIVNLCYKVRTGNPAYFQGWERNYLDTIEAGKYYTSPAIAIDSIGKAHIVFYKQTNTGADLYYMKQL